MPIENHCYEYEPERTRITEMSSGKAVALCVPPEHGLLLAAAPLFQQACTITQSILHREDLSAEMRVNIAQELLRDFLHDFQREEIRALPSSL